jgi:hypothetical protein
MHDAHHVRDESVPILLHDEDHGHALDESNPRLSKLHLIACCVEAHHDRSYVHLCDNELRQLCAELQSAELLDDHHRGTNDRYLDDHDLLEDDRDPLNHRDHTTDDHRDRHDLLTDGHCLGDRDLLEDDPLNHHGYKTSAHRDHHDLRDLLTDDRDLLEDDPLNHHGYKTDGHRDHHDLRDLLTDDHDLLEDDPLNHHGYKTGDHRDHRDLLTDDHDLRHHFVRTQDDLLDDYLDGLGVRHDCPKDDPDCPKDGHYLDDHGLRLVCLNDHLHRRDGLDAMVCRILLPVADDVDRDFLGLALDEVYLQTTRKRRTYAICD